MAAIRAILIKFGIMTWFCTLDRSDRLKKLKIHDGAGRHLEKSKNRHIAGIRTHNR